MRSQATDNLSRFSAAEPPRAAKRAALVWPMSARVLLLRRLRRLVFLGITVKLNTSPSEALISKPGAKGPLNEPPEPPQTIRPLCTRRATTTTELES
jgi:hypothetical protein